MIASGDAWERFEQLAAELAAADNADEFERVLTEYRKFVTGPLYAQLSPYMRERADHEFARRLYGRAERADRYEITPAADPDARRRILERFPLGKIDGEPLSQQIIRERR